jgi:hypothetical protein
MQHTLHVLWNLSNILKKHASFSRNLPAKIPNIHEKGNNERETSEERCEGFLTKINLLRHHRARKRKE